MDREARHAAVHGVVKSQTWLSDWTELNWRLCLSREVVRKWVFTERTISKLVLPTYANWCPEKFTWSHITPGSSPILAAKWGLQILSSSRNTSQLRLPLGMRHLRLCSLSLEEFFCFVSTPQPLQRWQDFQRRPDWREELRERDILAGKRLEKPSLPFPYRWGWKGRFSPFFKICPPLPCPRLILCDSRTSLF